MQVRFEKAGPKDARVLAEICERAFHSDVNYGAPGPTGGPPGYYSDRFQIQLMIASEYYKILLDDKIVGGIFFGPVAYQHYELIRIFIAHEYQHQGIGTQAMAFMERRPARNWHIGSLPTATRRIT